MSLFGEARYWAIQAKLPIHMSWRIINPSNMELCREVGNSFEAVALSDRAEATRELVEVRLLQANAQRYTDRNLSPQASLRHVTKFRS